MAGPVSVVAGPVSAIAGIVPNHRFAEGCLRISFRKIYIDVADRGDPVVCSTISRMAKWCERSPRTKLGLVR